MKELETLYKECVRYGTIIQDKNSTNFIGEYVRSTIFQFYNRYYHFTLVNGVIKDFSFRKI